MIISIDIGTSYSSLCIKNAEGKAEPVEISTGISIYGSKYSLPSAVFVNSDGSVLVGQAAMNSCKSNPRNFRAEFKRDLGQNVPIMLGERSFLPEDLYTELFLHMKSCLEKISNEKIEKVYITHPVSFEKNKKEKIINAAKNAGFFKTMLIDEPTAAAMCYTANGDLKDEDVFLVYDFGGGTFDTALVEYKDSNFRSIGAPSGIEHCGGIDIDRIIYADMMSKIPEETKEMLSQNPIGKMRFNSQLAELAVKIKHQLSFSTEATETIPVGFDVIDYNLKRNDFNNMIAHLIEQTVECCRGMLSNENMTLEDISGILLVGGTSRIPLVREMLQSFAKDTPICSDVDPELAVVQGALEYNGTDESEAEVLIRLAENGNSDAQYKLGLYYLGDSKNECEAVYWLEKAGENGNEKAFYQLGKCYCEGKGTQKDINRAIELFVKCPESQSSSSLRLKIADLYANEKNDYDSAIKWFEKVIGNDEEKDSFDACYAQYRLGECYYFGRGTVRDYIRAMHMFEKVSQSSAGRNHDFIYSAEYFLGECYYNGTGADRDYSKAIYWYGKAVQGSNIDARFRLGECFITGKGIKKDIDKGIGLLAPIAELGNISAQVILGKVYDEEKSNFSSAFALFEKVAMRNDKENITDIAFAQYKLGLYYHYGKGVVIDNIKSVYWYEKASENGNGRARLNLANRYLTGDGVPKNVDKSIMLLQKAALENDIAKAYVSLAKIHSTETHDYAEAIYWAERVAEKNDSENIHEIVFAQQFLGKCYFQGIGTKEDFSKALYWYEKAAKNGDYSESFKLGVEYIRGVKIEKDIDKGIFYLKKAVANGIKTAASSAYLSIAYSKEKNDYKTAIRWAKKTSMSDDKEHSLMIAATQYWLGNCYYNGNGTSVDYTEAVFWFKKAADKDPYAKCMLGVCFENGHGVDRDYEKAIDLYTKSRSEGYSYASIRLGMCFLDGIGVAKNLKQSALYFKEVLEKESNNSQAMYFLGKVYTQMGGLRNLYLAKKQYEASAEHGYSKAAAALAETDANIKKTENELRELVAQSASAKKKFYRDGFYNEYSIIESFMPDNDEHSNYIYMNIITHEDNYSVQINEKTKEVKIHYIFYCSHYRPKIKYFFVKNWILVFGHYKVARIPISFDTFEITEYKEGMGEYINDYPKNFRLKDFVTDGGVPMREVIFDVQVHGRWSKAYIDEFYYLYSPRLPYLSKKRYKAEYSSSGDWIKKEECFTF